MNRRDCTGFKYYEINPTKFNYDSGAKMEVPLADLRAVAVAILAQRRAAVPKTTAPTAAPPPPTLQPTSSPKATAAIKGTTSGAGARHDATAAESLQLVTQLYAATAAQRARGQRIWMLEVKLGAGVGVALVVFVACEWLKRRRATKPVID